MVYTDAKPPQGTMRIYFNCTYEFSVGCCFSVMTVTAFATCYGHEWSKCRNP